MVGHAAQIELRNAKELNLSNYTPRMSLWGQEV
jgi:hypothetical protein